MDIDELAEQQRLESAAKAKRIAQRRDEATFWDGSSANNLPTTISSNGPLRTGQSVNLTSAGGINQADTFSRAEPENALLPIANKGDVWVLVRKLKSNGKYSLYLGGKIQRPLLVADDLVSTLFSYLDLKTADDWVVSYKSFPNANNCIVGSISGSLSTITDTWAITSPVCNSLLHYGYGFFASPQVGGMQIGRFTDFDSTPFPVQTRQPPGLGVPFRGGSHGGVGGLSTRKVEYYETFGINGALSATATGHDYRSGIVQPTNLGIEITGTNEYRVDAVQIGSYIGSAQGPGSLERGESDFCDLSETPIRGTLLNPKITLDYTATTSSNFSANNYSFSAYAGSLNISEGQNSYVENYTNLYKQTSYTVFGVTKRIDYIANCQEYVDPHQFLWSIGIEYSEAWDFELPTSSIDYQGLTATLSNTFALAPGVTKTTQYTAGRTIANAQVLGNSQYYEPSKVINGGYVYKKTLASGTASFSFQNSGPFPTWSHTDSPQLLLNFNGQEIELVQALGTDLAYIHQDSNPYPVGYKAIQKGSDDIHFDNTKYNDIFKKSIEIEVSVSTGTLSTGKLTYGIQKETKSHKALPIKVNSRADFSDVGLVAWRYLPKG